jgi:hypothetical protein
MNCIVPIITAARSIRLMVSHIGKAKRHPVAGAAVAEFFG